MTSLRIATVIVTLVVATVCGVASTLVSVEMAGELNGKLPEKERSLEAFRYPGKARRLISRHAQLVPYSKLRMVYRMLVTTMTVCLLAIAVMLGFFRR